MDVGKNTTLSDGNSGKKLVQLFIVTDGELEMTWVNPVLLVVASSISCQFQDLSGEVFHDGSQVDWGTGSNSLGIVARSEKTMYTSYRELKSRTVGTTFGLGTSFASFSTSRHSCSSLLVDKYSRNILLPLSKDTAFFMSTFADQFQWITLALTNQNFVHVYPIRDVITFDWL